MRRRTAAALLAAAFALPAVASPPAPAAAQPPAAASTSKPTSRATPTVCADGTTSNATGRGACSGHGGVAKPTARCKDGSFHVKRERRGACSGRGGVAEWLDRR